MRLLLATVLALAPLAAAAQSQKLFKCPDAKGKVQYVTAESLCAGKAQEIKGTAPGGATVRHRNAAEQDKWDADETERRRAQKNRPM